MHLKITLLNLLTLTSFPKTKYKIHKLHVFTKSMLYFNASILFIFLFGHCFNLLAPTFIHNNLFDY